MSADAHAGVERDLLRTTMGTFATGVTVVTSRAPDGTDFGTTANAVSSVSLHPPLVLVCLRRESETLACVQASGRFAVNVLERGQRRLAERFAKRAATDTWFGVRSHGGEVLDVPVLDGALASLECRVHDIADGGDHLILVGLVVHAEHAEGAPLLFHRGAFADLEAAVEERETATAPPPVAASAALLGVQLPSEFGPLQIVPVDHGDPGCTTAVVVFGQRAAGRPVPVYVHRGCLLGDAFGSLACRRGKALRHALATMHEAGAGVIVYHRDDALPFECCGGGAAHVGAVGASHEESIRAVLDELALEAVELLHVDGEDPGELVSGLHVATRRAL